jgi:hypothetical protein
MKNDIMIVIYVNDLIFTKFDRAIFFLIEKRFKRTIRDE